MKKCLFIAVFVFSTSLCRAQKEQRKYDSDTLKWHTLLSEAYDLSKSTGKPVFAFFTGSDWCKWCQKLQQDVFAKPAFIEWADLNVVLLELDFPRRKKLAQDLVRQNVELQQVFEVDAFPTIRMFCLAKDEVEKKINISVLGSLGYPSFAETGKEEVSFLANATRMLSNCKK